ncbi:MAG: hypothetical protein NT165_03760 [Candidatus Falkowbacteria bacterium]|nr:hypothetical protein [Candidatus Falkowbacteria bacterium]
MIATVDEFKIYAGIDTDDDDEGLELVLKGAIGWAESICDNAMEQKEFVELFDGARYLFMANNLNVLDVVVEQFQTEGWAVITPETDYRLDAGEGYVVLQEVTLDELNYRITYKAGYVNAVPSDLKMVILKMVGEIWNKRKSDGVKDEKLGDAQVIWENFLTDDVVAVLHKYRKFNI